MTGGVGDPTTLDAAGKDAEACGVKALVTWTYDFTTWADVRRRPPQLKAAGLMP
ncbi:hypothetical protein [Streptomyces sp. NPDC049949]|uniref:hypothetical protein n=1 Tax=Streptomyces sp. NPDC049949 TaxID=3154627 RepID=UPI00344258D6